MRHRFVRTLFQEILKASRIEKIVLIIPFIVLLLDAEIFYFAWVNGEKRILLASAFVLILSILEIFAVIEEIHSHLTKIMRREFLEEKIREIAKEIERPTVRKIVDKFMASHPRKYSVDEVYEVACDVLYELRNQQMRE